MRITVAEAGAYFEHPSQQVGGITPDSLPDEPFEYWADGPVCLAFGPGPLAGIWVAHIAAKRRGGLEPHVCGILRAFWRHHKPKRVVAWIPDTSRLVVALARRCGFIEDGRFPGVIMTGWRP